MYFKFISKSSVLNEGRQLLNSMSKFLISLSLLSITTCSIYNVTPDDTTCHHCHNLQHYLLNTTKYFTSNTQLLFLPGLHHLHTNLIIQNVYNISLIGSTTNGTTPDTVIQCDSSVGIVMKNITLLIMKNMTIQNCTARNQSLKATIIITDCSYVQLHHMHSKPSNIFPTLIGVNIFGESCLNDMKGNMIKLIYNDTTTNIKYHTIFIDHYKISNVTNTRGIYFKNNQQSYKITLYVTNLHIESSNYYITLSGSSNKFTNNSMIYVENCQVSSNQRYDFFF